MTIADLIRREADAWSRVAANPTAPEDYAKHARMVSVLLRNVAGVTEVHGYAGLMGYMACMRYSSPVDNDDKQTAIRIVDRILRGEGH